MSAERCTDKEYVLVKRVAEFAHHQLFEYNLTQAWRVILLHRTTNWPGFKRGASMDTDRILSFAIGILSGSIVGAAAVILLTPQSGQDLRQNIVAKYQDILESGRQAMADRRQTLEAEYQTRIQIPLNPPKE